MVAVKDVLAQPALALRGVVVPHPLRPVRWVATSELADPSPFLEGGELLLTTGLSTRGWDGEWEGYVARLGAAGVAAIGFGTGLTHATVPPALARACRERAVNLFEVPRPTTFVAISRLTARLLQEHEQADARRAVAMQRELTEAASRRGDPLAPLRTLAAQLGGGAAVVAADGAGEVDVVGAPPPAGLDLAAEVARIRPQGLRAAASVSVAGHTCLIQPVGLSDRPESYLAVWSPQRLTDGRRGAVTTTVALLGLAAERRNDRRATDRRLRARALELVLTGDARTAAVLLAAVEDLPGEVRLPARLRVACASGPAERLEDALAALEAAPGAAVLAARAGEELRVVDAPGRTETTAARLAELGLRVGVGAAVGLDEGERGATTARYALAQTTEALVLVRWDDLVDDGVMALVSDEAAAAFAASYLRPLAARADLLATLRAFLRHHGSRGKVAVELGVHRNTVRHRLEEIEAGLGRSLDDPATRVSAWVALQADAARRLEG